MQEEEADRQREKKATRVKRERRRRVAEADGDCHKEPDVPDHPSDRFKLHLGFLAISPDPGLSHSQQPPRPSLAYIPVAVESMNTGTRAISFCLCLSITQREMARYQL